VLVPAVAIGRVLVDPPLVLAPLAGVCLRPFRLVCKRFGAGLVCGEMISAMALHYGSPGSRRMLALDPAERPVSVQIAAGSPDAAAEATGSAVAAGADVVDLNFGCPVSKVRKSGAGAILMRSPSLARRIVRAAADAAGAIPVTVKMRAGWDDDSVNFRQIADIAVDEGCAAVTLHARTAVRMYSGSAHWPWIAELVRAVPVPVIGNGDVSSGADARRMVEQTGCAAVMIGRAAQGAPWVFAQARAVLRGEEPPPDPGLRERLRICLELCEGLAEELGEHLGCLHARKALGWFGRGMPGAARFREQANRVSSLDDVRALIATCATGEDTRTAVPG